MSDLRERQLGALSSDGAALLIVDVQRSFGDPSMLDGYGLDDAAFAAVASAVERCRELVEAARASGVPVYWIELATETRWRSSAWLRTGDPDTPLDDDEPCVVGTPGAEWYRLAPDAEEVRVRKIGYSGFLATGLAERLRADGIRWVSVAGLTTECCIQATATDAVQLDWQVYIPGDATAAYDLELHEGALAQMALNVGVIGTSAELASLWERRMPAASVSERDVLQGAAS